MGDSEFVIFDCDGVLVDSEVISNEVLAQALTAEGLPTTLIEARQEYQGLLLGEVVARGAVCALAYSFSAMSRGRFYLRCESEEWDFIRSLKAPCPFDAAVISDRYLADYPDGHARHSQPRDRLIGALAAHGAHWSVDPDTARLEQASSRQRQRPRAGNRPLARALPLPLSAERLSTQDAVDALLEAGSVHQHASRAFVAPYLEVTGPADPRFAVNLRLLERAGQLAGDRTLIAYLQVLRGDLIGGGASAAASALARGGAAERLREIGGRLSDLARQAEDSAERLLA